MYCLITYFKKDGDVDIDEVNLSYEQACEFGDVSELKTDGYSVIRHDFMNDIVRAIVDVDFDKDGGIFTLVKSRLRDYKINKILEPEEKSWKDWLKKI